jgi:hypothetical protein
MEVVVLYEPQSSSTLLPQPRPYSAAEKSPLTEQYRPRSGKRGHCGACPRQLWVGGGLDRARAWWSVPPARPAVGRRRPRPCPAWSVAPCAGPRGWRRRARSAAAEHYQARGGRPSGEPGRAGDPGDDRAARWRPGRRGARPEQSAAPPRHRSASAGATRPGRGGPACRTGQLGRGGPAVSAAPPGRLPRLVRAACSRRHARAAVVGPRAGRGAAAGRAGRAGPVPGRRPALPGRRSAPGGRMLGPTPPARRRRPATATAPPIPPSRPALLCRAPAGRRRPPVAGSGGAGLPALVRGWHQREPGLQRRQGSVRGRPGGVAAAGACRALAGWGRGAVARRYSWRCQRHPEHLDSWPRAN